MGSKTPEGQVAMELEAPARLRRLEFGPKPGAIGRNEFWELARTQFGYVAAQESVDVLLWRLSHTVPRNERYFRGGRFVVRSTERCVGTVLVVDVSVFGNVEGCGDRLFLAACLGCEWEGTQTRDQDAAIEECCDHAWPGWRDLPVIDLVEYPAESRSNAAARFERQTRECNEVMPGWYESGAPVRRRAEPGASCHYWFGDRWRIAVAEPSPTNAAAPAGDGIRELAES